MRQGGSLVTANKALVKVQYKIIIEKSQLFNSKCLPNIICLLDELYLH